MNTTNQTLGNGIETQKDVLANLIVNIQWTRNPQFKDHYGETGHAKESLP